MSRLSRLFARHPGRRHPRRSAPPRVERLEDRLVPVNPTVLDPNLGLRTVASGLTTPTSMVFLGDNDFFVTEKNTGKIDHVINGVAAATRFDLGAGPVANLPVNFNSERGLLGIALSPNFANDHNVYLYWTENNSGPAPDGNVADVPVLGNRVDRFIWNPLSSTLTFDKNIVRLHAFQNDGNGGNPAQMQGNHNGGVIKFGPDGKLYVVIGDNGRRGWMQNLINGPNGPGQTDENNGPVRGGPAPDDAHLTGVMLRLNPDGSTPDDNPFADIRNTLGSVLTGLPGSRSLGTGSLTAFLNQVMDTFTVIITAQGLTSASLDGGADIRFGGTDGPSILNVSDFPGGIASGQFTTTLTAANFTPDPADGINTFDDAVSAVLGGRTSFTVSTAQNPDGEIGGHVAQLAPAITANLHKVFAYGIRNTFGYDFDPFTGRLWLEEDGDQSFDKISIVDAGANDGWIQSSAPLVQFDGSLDPGALAEFKSIERRLSPNGAQQTRWSTANIADTPEQALSQLVMLPGAFYNAPVFSVRAEFPPAGLGFMTGSALGPEYEGALFYGEARDFLTAPGREEFDGALLVFHPNADRTGIDFQGDPNVRASDGVFMNDRDFDLNGDTTFLLGEGFGIGTDIQTGPNGDLFVVSETKGLVLEIFRKDAVAPFREKNLVSDIANPPGGAPEVVDSSLKNPWGVSFGPTTPFWVSDQAAGVSTLYAGDVPQADGSISPVTKVGLTVTIPPAAGRTQGTPTGQVFNGTTDFKLANGSPARFIFAAIDGTISAWNSGTRAETKATTAGAVYTGLALGANGSGNFLYAANTRAGRIDVFDKNFAPATLVGNFEDPDLPPGSYTPFNVENLNGDLYVAFRNRADPEHGGVIDAFDTDGNFERRVVSGGVNAPWGMAFAPDDFGPFGGALLVGNFGLGDGKISAFDPDSGAFLGNLTDANGTPFAFERIWALTFGNGGNGGDPHALYFTAGINAEKDGLFGVLRPVVSTPAGPDSLPAGPGDDGPAAGGGPSAGLVVSPGVPAPAPGDVPPAAAPGSSGGDDLSLLLGLLFAGGTDTPVPPTPATSDPPSQGIPLLDPRTVDRLFTPVKGDGQTAALDTGSDGTSGDPLAPDLFGSGDPLLTGLVAV